jgi:hypothetical protein
MLISERLITTAENFARLIEGLRDGWPTDHLKHLSHAASLLTKHSPSVSQGAVHTCDSASVKNEASQRALMMTVFW